jgi:peptidoglycan/xylan/chitin deacetylase (PgdA/CDA1 family)
VPRAAARMLKSALAARLARPAVWSATKPLRQAGLVALTYHRIGPGPAPSTFTPVDVFRDQVRWLRQHCHIVAPATMATGRHDRWNGPNARPSVLLTFDDGYRDFHDVAYPILRDANVPVVNFLATYFIDSSEPYWWDLLEFAVATTTLSTARVSAGGRLISLDGSGRKEFLREAKSLLKRIPVAQTSPQLQDIVRAVAGHTKLRMSRQAMTWDEVRATAHLTTFGGHTRTHAWLPVLGPSERDSELSLCRERILAETGQSALFFAYPYGAHDASTRAAVAGAGYAVAFTTEKGFNSPEQDPLAMKRIYAPSSVAELAWILTGWFAS